MPINEFSNPGSNLTTEQQKEAMASLYSPPQQQGNVNISLTPEQYRMLQMLQAQAGNLMDQPIREFDLNKPPVEPYRYQEFPFTLYNHRTRQNRIVRNHIEREQWIAEGWRSDPFPSEFQEVELSADEQVEAQAAQRILDAPKKKGTTK